MRSITAHKLAEILMRAREDAPVRFWIGDDDEADFDLIYDDATDSDDEDLLVAEGADVVNIDLEPLVLDDEILGAGDDGYMGDWQYEHE